MGNLGIWDGALVPRAGWRLGFMRPPRASTFGPLGGVGEVWAGRALLMSACSRETTDRSFGVLLSFFLIVNVQVFKLGVARRSRRLHGDDGLLPRAALAAGRGRLDVFVSRPSPTNGKAPPHHCHCHFH